MSADDTSTTRALADFYGHQAVQAPESMGAFWMPFTANRQFKATPRLLASASGMHYTTVDGRQILDATAGLWCCNAGHARPRIVEAVKKQIETLDFAPNFQMSSPLPFVLAERLAALTPGDLNHVFYTNSGSEAVDSALKIALAYHRTRGEGQRTRLIGREKGYHGVGFGEAFLEIYDLLALLHPLDPREIRERLVAGVDGEAGGIHAPSMARARP